MEETNFKFPKKNKLKSKIAIQSLFEKGISIQENNIKILFHPNSTSLHKIAVTVPKRNYKLATDRNLIKRQIRECYRLNQNLIKDINVCYDIIFIFLDKKKPNYHFLNQNIIHILSKLRDLKN